MGSDPPLRFLTAKLEVNYLLPTPLDVTLAQAVELLAQPKTRGRRAAVKKEPIKVFDESPATGEKIQLLDGRYGPYVTDGATNASLPKSTAPEELTFDEAVQLLAEKAAKGGTRKKAKKKAAKKKTTAKKKAARKTAAKKPTVKKKAATKKKTTKATKKKATKKK